MTAMTAMTAGEISDIVLDWFVRLVIEVSIIYPILWDKSD